MWLQIIRHLLPNGIDFTLVVKKTVKDVQNWMNTYHRRILGDMDEERFKKEILPLIKFSEAKMAYNVGREVLSKDFADAINKKIADVESRKDFDHFILFYQAIIAYTKYEKFEKDEEYRAQKYQPTQNYYNGGKK